MNWTQRIKHWTTKLGLLIFLCICFGFFTSPAYSATLGPVAPTWDGYISDFIKSNLAIHSATYVAVGTAPLSPEPARIAYRTFYQFDISSINDPSTIVSANLTLFCANANVTYPYSISRVAPGSMISDSMSWNSVYITGGGAITNTTLLDTQSIAARSFDATGTSYSWNLLSNPHWAEDITNGTLSLLLRNDESTDDGSGGFLTRNASFWDSGYEVGGGNAYPDGLQPYLVMEHTAVPIPGAVWLLGSGLIGIVGIRKKFKT